MLEMRKNEQNVVLNESLKALGNRSEIVQILVLAMTTADDGVVEDFRFQILLIFNLLQVGYIPLACK